MSMLVAKCSDLISQIYLIGYEKLGLVPQKKCHKYVQWKYAICAHCGKKADIKWWWAGPDFSKPKKKLRLFCDTTTIKCVMKALSLSPLAVIRQMCL